MNRERHHYEWFSWDDTLPLCADDIVERWLVLITAADPWDNMRLDDVTGEIRRVTEALINAAGDGEELRRRQIAAAAFEHGLFRRGQRLPHRTLAVELATLREAIRLGLRDANWSAALVHQATDGLVQDIRLARQVAERAQVGLSARQTVSNLE